MVGEGTDITIIARSSLERLMGTTDFRIAKILSTGIIIVTQQVIGFAIAVVVEAVANLGGRDHGVTGGQTVLGADTLALTTTKFVGNLTGSPEGQFNRFVSTWATTSIGDTLLSFDSVDSLSSSASESPWAVTIDCACTTTKGALIAIVDADIFGPGDALTVVASGTWTTKVGMVGDADEDQVGRGTGYLLTAPAGRAFGSALLRAEPFSHVFDTPAREALFTIYTGVEEAPITGVTQTAQVFRNVREEQLQPPIEGGDIDSEIAADNIGHCSRAITLLDVISLHRIQEE